MNPDDLLRLEAAMQAVLDDHLDGHARELTRAWARVWVDVAAELEASIVGQVALGNVDGALPLDPARARAAMEVVRANLDELAAYTGGLLSDSVPDITALGATGEAAMYRVQGVVSFNRADDEQMKAIVARSTEQITALTLALAPDTEAAIRRRLNRGIALGDNPRLVAEQIVNDARGDMNLSLARALNISRTEMLDALRSAQYVTDQANRSILRGWTWVAHLDARTCPSCIAMHGTEWAVEDEGPLDHHSGRCARVPITHSWASQGLTAPRDTPPPIPDATEWFTSLPEETQRAILGKRGWEAWQKGAWPMGEWSHRVDTPAWRPAYYTTRPPKMEETA